MSSPFLLPIFISKKPALLPPEGSICNKSGVERKKNGEDLLFSTKDEKGLGYFYPGMVAKETEIIGRVMQGSN